MPNSIGADLRLTYKADNSLVNDNLRAVQLYSASAAAFSDIRCKCFLYRHSRGKQITVLKGTMNERMNREGVYVSCWTMLYMNGNKIAIKFVICLHEVCKWIFSINVKLCVQSHLPEYILWNLWVHSLGVRISLSCRQHKLTLIWILFHILLPCPCYTFAQNVII